MTHIIPAYGVYAPSPAQNALIRLARGTFLKRGSFRPILAKLVDMLRPGPIDLSFMNVPFRLRPSRSSADLGMAFNADYNGMEIRFLKKAIPPQGVFVDIGCNIGMYALPIARAIHASGGRVVGFEPHPEALRYLKENLAAASHDNFLLVETAVGDSAGEAVIDTDADNLGASRIAAGGDTVISIKPLKDMLAAMNIDRVDALKIDIEGYEDRALLPFFETAPVSLWPKAICMEDVNSQSWKGDLISALEQRGYRAVERTRCNLLLMRQA